MQKSKTQNFHRYYSKKFQKAQRLQQTGYIAEAEKTYQEILHDIPDNPDCIHFLGLLFFQRGELDKAENNYKRSIDLAKNPTYLNNYALLAHHRKEYKKAVNLLLESIKLKPNNAEAWYNLGCIYSETGDLNNAEESYLNVIKYNDKHIKALFNLVCVQEKQEKKEDLKKTITMIMAFQPNSPEQYYSLAIAITRLNIKDSHKLAVNYLREAISKNPNSIEAYRALATLHVERNRLEKAKEVYEKIIKKEPNFQQLNLEYGNCLVKAGEIDKSAKIFNKILKNDENNLAALNGIADGQRLRGNFIEAKKIFEDILKKDVDNITAYIGLANCEKFTDKNDTFLKKMKILVDQKTTSAGYFALGKIYDDLKSYDNAIDNYRKGNALKNQRIRFDKEKHIAQIDLIIDTFNKKFIEKLQLSSNSSEQPIFILGAPRSGTTLVEQIISSHSRVFGAGELQYIGNIATGSHQNEYMSFPNRFRNNQDQDMLFVKSDAEYYLNKIKNNIIDKDIIRVTDKMPANFLFLGYIFSMFPNCKIINTQRNPIDTCLSIFFQNFYSGHMYAFDFNNLIVWYKQYIRLMKHWNSIFAEKVYTVHYDKIVTDTENSIRNIISYCNLEWEDECLSFYNSKRVINTASNWQVKQPIYKTSNQKWKNYEKFIPELIDGLSEFIRD